MHEPQVEPYCPTPSELAKKVVVISDESVSILQDFHKSISKKDANWQVGGMLVDAAKKIGNIQVSGAYFFERYMRRRIKTRGEDWPAIAALGLIEELIRFFEQMKTDQMQRLF